MSIKSRFEKLKKFKLFKTLNIVDIITISFITIALLVLSITRLTANQSGSITAQDMKPVEIDVFFEKVKLTGSKELFIPGKQTYITIRNVPYNKLDIIKATKTSTKTPKVYNLIVTIKDNAVITSDGPVVGGNKLKTGLPITLEGFNYKFWGVVSDVRIGEGDAFPAQ